MKKKDRVVFPEGFLAAGTDAGISLKRKPDMAIFYSARPCAAAGFFTANRVKAAPVLISKKNIGDKRAQVIIVNSGCANACTGKKGFEDALWMTEYTARKLKIKPADVLVASTGLIGSFLPVSKIKAGIRDLCGYVKKNQSYPLEAAEAILTTDTKKKVAWEEFRIKGSKVVLWGTIKGAGMIQPKLATMLGFIMSDINISRKLLEVSLKRAIDKSFNLLTVDGQTSTNDTVFAMAGGAAGNSIIDSENDDFVVWQKHIDSLTLKLARMIAEDGEGATKLIEVRVVNAKTAGDARDIAKSIANSVLFKTAIHGKSANWGRVMCAAGNAGVSINPGRIDISYDDLMLVKNGSAINYSENRIKRILRKKEVLVTVDLKSGSSGTSVYTCDLTREYIKINADYN